MIVPAATTFLIVVARLFITIMFTFMLKQFYLAVLADASSRVKEEDATRVVRGIDEEVPIFVRYALNKFLGRGPSFEAMLELLPEQQGEAVDTARRRRRIRRGITGTDRRAEDNIMEQTFVGEDELTPALHREDLATLLGYAAGRAAETPGAAGAKGNTLVTKRAMRFAIDTILHLELEPREFRQLEQSATLAPEGAAAARDDAALQDSAEEDADAEEEEVDDDDDPRTAARAAMTRRVVAATRASLRAVRREALLQRESVAASARVLDRLARVEVALRDALAAARLSARRDGGDPAAMRARIATAMADVDRRAALRAAALRGWAAVRAAFLRDAPTTEGVAPLKSLAAVVVAATRKAKPADEFWVVLDKRINRHGFLRRKDKFFSVG